MTQRSWLFGVFLLLLSASGSNAEEVELKDFRGVVTAQLLPAKVLKVNQIIPDPKPGTSPIGEKGLLVEVEENPTVMANWTVVKVRYTEYPEPKIIHYKVLSDEYQITVRYHAVSVVIDGDLSAYLEKP
jgi:hypothetical protein